MTLGSARELGYRVQRGRWELDLLGCGWSAEELSPERSSGSVEVERVAGPSTSLRFAQDDKVLRGRRELEFDLVSEGTHPDHEGKGLGGGDAGLGGGRLLGFVGAELAGGFVELPDGDAGGDEDDGPDGDEDGGGPLGGEAGPEMEDGVAVVDA